MRTIQEAAKAAAIGKDNDLWNACIEIARKQDFVSDPKISNTKMCELALEKMTETERLHHLRRRV